MSNESRRLIWLQQPGTDIRFYDYNDWELDAEAWFNALEQGIFSAHYDRLERDRWVERIISAQCFYSVVIGNQRYETIQQATD